MCPRSTRAIGVSERQLDFHQLAIAKCGEINHRARRPFGNHHGEITRTHERCAVDCSDYVAGFDSRLSGGTTRFGLAKDCTVGFNHTKAVGECACHRTNLNANPSAEDGAPLLVLGYSTGWPRLSEQDEAADQDSRTDRDAHEPSFPSISKG